MGTEASKDLFVDLDPMGESIGEEAWVTTRDERGHLIVPANTSLGRQIQEKNKVVPGHEVPREIYTEAGHLSDTPNEARPQVLAAVYTRLGAILM